MKATLSVLILCASSLTAVASEWPVVKTYEGVDIEKVRMPLGGVGTGTISLSGRGGLVDWEIFNVPPKGKIADGLLHGTMGAKDLTNPDFRLGAGWLVDQLLGDIRDRYDGRKRNPFDEAECGHHYARALAAWTVLKAFDPGFSLIQKNEESEK